MWFEDHVKVDRVRLLVTLHIKSCNHYANQSILLHNIFIQFTVTVNQPSNGAYLSIECEFLSASVNG